MNSAIVPIQGSSVCGSNRQEIRMSTPVSLMKKKPMTMTLAMHEMQTKKANSAFLAQAVVRISHKFSVIFRAPCEAYELGIWCPTPCSVSSMTCFLERTLPFQKDSQWLFSLPIFRTFWLELLGTASLTLLSSTAHLSAVSSSRCPVAPC